MKKVSSLLLALLLLLTTLGPTVVNAEGEFVVNDSIKTYVTAYDAKEKVNSVGTYSAGTYFIYKEYDGMLNISTSSGPGAWINPEDNSSVVQPPASTSPSFSKLYRVSDGPVNIRTNTSTSSSIIGKAYNGRAFEGELEGKWLKINYEGRIAYTWASYYYQVTQPVTRYTTGGLNVRASDTSSSTKLGYFNKGSKVVGSTMGNGWFRTTYNNRTAYVFEKYLSKYAPSTSPVIPSTSYSSLADKVVSIARSKVGLNYVWGTAGPYTFDCSGLTYYSYKQVGISLYRTSRDQYNNGRWVSFSNMKPGDLIFFGTSASSIYHVGIYAGNRQMIHASTPERGVVIDSVDSSWVKNTYYGVRRIID